MRDERITYEVALEPDAEILPDFEAWLEYHVDEMLALPGVTGASIHQAEDPDSGAVLRVVRYQLADRAALERYLDEFAPRMRAEGRARFGGRSACCCSGRAASRSITCRVSVPASCRPPACSSPRASCFSSSRR